MKKPLWMVLWLVMIQLAVILVLVPSDLTERAIEQETRYVQRSLGLQSQHWINSKAQQWYQTSLIDSGAYEAAYNHLIPTEEQKQASRGMEGMGKLWFKWIEGRLEAFGKLVYQFYTRLALLMLWLPYMLVLLIPALYDGLMSRKIKLTNFDYASPIVHRYSMRSVWFIATGMSVLFLAPIAIDPIYIPLLLMASCVLLGLAVGNMQKRI